MSTILDHIAKKPKIEEVEDLDADRLRALAEMASRRLSYILETIHTTMEAYAGLTISLEDGATNTVSDVQSDVLARPDSSAFSSQMRAYRENA